MPTCENCGGRLSRRPRNLAHKLIRTALFRCDDCGTQWQYDRPFLTVFRLHCHCPRCHTSDVSILRKADPVDKMSSNPLRALLGLIGAPLYHCTLCRFQFRDWRPLHSDSTAWRRDETD